MKGVTIITHPLVQHNLARLRDQRTGPQEFRRVLRELAALMIYEATRSFELKPISVKTPLAIAKGFQLRREVILIPVLRAGLGMLDPILQLVPHARVGFIGLKRTAACLVFRLLSISQTNPPILASFIDTFSAGVSQDTADRVNRSFFIKKGNNYRPSLPQGVFV